MSGLFDFLNHFDFTIKQSSPVETTNKQSSPVETNQLVESNNHQKLICELAAYVNKKKVDGKICDSKFLFIIFL